MARQSRKRTRDSPEVRREQIVDEAIRIIGQRGYHGFTVQQLAGRCGLSNAGLLYHFPTKDQLFAALVQQMEQREIEALRPFLENVQQEEQGRVPLTAVIDLFHAMVCSGNIEPELVRLYAVLQTESLDEGHPAHDSFRRREIGALDLFTKLVAPYVPEPRSTARQMLALADGLRLQWLGADQSFDLLAEWIRGVTLLVPEFAPLREKHGLDAHARTKSTTGKKTQTNLPMLAAMRRTRRQKSR
jgi:AcrR family transcriptional regulator